MTRARGSLPRLLALLGVLGTVPPLLANCKGLNPKASQLEGADVAYNLAGQVGKHCAMCHTGDGGMAAARRALDLGTLADVFDNKDTIVRAVGSTQKMPPFHVVPNETVKYVRGFGFDVGERETFVKAVQALDENQNMDAPIVAQGSVAPALSGPTVTFDTAAVTAGLKLTSADMIGPTDAYRCFVAYADTPSLAPLLGKGGYVTGVAIKSNDPAKNPIHHMLVHVAAPEIANQMKQYANQANGFSYPCYSNVLPEPMTAQYLESVLKVYKYKDQLTSGVIGYVKTTKFGAADAPSSQDVANAQAMQDLFSKVPLINTYEPGSAGLAFPAGAGIPVPKGAALILQVHYAVPDPAEFADPGLTIQISRSSKVQKLALYRFITDMRHFFDKPLKDRGATPLIVVPPGTTKQVSIVAPYADIVKQTQAILTSFGALTPKQQVTGLNLFAFNPHMHRSGKTFKINLYGAAGTPQEVLRIDHFYESWQRDYLMSNSVAIGAADLGKGKMELVCGYQNTWDYVIYGGFTSTDEMCLSSTLMTVDVTGGDSSTAGVPPTYDASEDLPRGGDDTSCNGESLNCAVTLMRHFGEFLHNTGHGDDCATYCGNAGKGQQACLAAAAAQQIDAPGACSKACGTAQCQNAVAQCISFCCFQDGACVQSAQKHLQM